MTLLRSLFSILLMGLLSGGCTNHSAPPLTQAETAMLHLVLANTHEVRIHQMRGASDNTVFLSPDGHREAVYDGAGRLVKDGFNDGSYNYAHPYKAPFEHFEQDIHPWLYMGSYPRDPTSVEERAYAYTQDIEHGLRSAIKQWSAQSGNYREDLIPPMPWVIILGRMEKQKVFGLISGDIEYTDENLISALKALNAAIEEAYS